MFDEPSNETPPIVLAVAKAVAVAALEFEPTYVFISENVTCFIVPSSLRTTLSASTIVVDIAEVPPSIIFNSAAVVVTAVPPIFNLSFIIFIVAPPAVSNSSCDSFQSIYEPDVEPNNFTS